MATPKQISLKGQAAIACDGWMTVWEGAIRSGKTVSSLVAWLLFLLESPDKIFFMSGRTLGSLVRNTIDGEYGFLSLAEPLARKTKDYAGHSIISIRDKTIYLFGADDDSSYMRLKGLTAGGWYADEVATHPQSFIIEGLARTAVSSMRRIFWTLNPCIPTHYIYSQFLDTWEGMPGYHRFHFTLDDNPAMTQQRKDELASQYHGRYYDMYILGLRCMIEGCVYPEFDDTCIVDEDFIAEKKRKHTDIFVCCDYGTINPCVFLEIFMCDDGVVYVSREFRWDSRVQLKQKTDMEYVQDMQRFIGIDEAIVVVDPSAASFIAALKIAGFFVKGAKNDVLEGIRRVNTLFAQKRLKICKTCIGLIDELHQYVWDERAARVGEERPVKAHDHGPDALRYFVNTCMSSFDILN